MSQIMNKFFLRVSVCVSALALGFWILTPTASMQDEEMEIRTAPPANVAMSANVSANYQPAPERVSTVRGRIFYGDTGRPLRRAGFILLASNGMGGGREFSGVTNERGEFEIKNVREGRYFISVSTPGVLSPFSSLSTLDGAFARGNMEEQMANIIRDFQEIVVTGNGDVDATITVKRGAAISGRIVYADGEPAAGIRVEVLRKTGGEYSAVIPNISEIFGAIFGGGAGGMKTDDRGVFRVAALPAGEYIVRAVENAVHGERKGGGRDAEMLAVLGMNPSSMLATYFPNVSDVKQAETIKLEAGQEAPEIVITIPDRSMHKVGVIVLNKATRQPLKNVRVSLKAKEGVNSLFGSIPDFGSGTQTDEQGRLSFKEIPTGKYTLVVQPPYSWEEETPKDANQPKPPKLARAEKEITIEDKDIEDLVVEMNYGAVITGTVNFEKNDTLPPMLYFTATEQEGKISEGGELQGSFTKEGKPIVRKSAEFKIEGLPGGKFFLSAARAEKSDVENGFYVKSILYNGRDIRYAPLEVKEGDAIKGVQIILSKELGKLKGKVARADGGAVVGAKISFVPTDKEKWANFSASLFAVTNGDGEFEVSGAPDEYFVVFINAEDESEKEGGEKKSAAQNRREWLERKTSGAEKVTIKAKQTETANFKLP
jgi:5-hydroxyisourate hydrolase-like protein (transthyretin family)